MSTKWHKGPPPGIGWWPASACRCAGVLRWWDGSSWSMCALEGYSKHQVKAAAELRAVMLQHEEIEWTERPASWRGKGGA